MKILEVIFWLLYAIYSFVVGVGIILILLNGLTSDWGKSSWVEISLSQILIIFSSILLGLTLIWVGSGRSKYSQKIMKLSDYSIFLVFLKFLFLALYLDAFSVFFMVAGGLFCLLCARLIHYKRLKGKSDEEDADLVLLRIWFSAAIVFGICVLGNLFLFF